MPDFRTPAESEERVIATQKPMRCAWSSSGGKDSLLALWHARNLGHDVTTMITMFDETGTRSRSHGIDLSMMYEQAAALGMELIAPSATWKSYETEFVNALRVVRTNNCGGVVFGDIDLQPHRDWEEKVCAHADLTAILPLWQRPRPELAKEVLRLGFKSKVVCIDHRFLTPDFCGREYDDEFVRSLPSGVDACGENGEFHTFVYDGPTFSKALDVAVERIEDYVAPLEFGGTRYSFARLTRKAR